MKSNVPSYRGYRFPPDIISHAVWLYHRFCLSFRDVERPPGRAWDYRILRDDPTVVSEVWYRIRPPTQATTGSLGRHLAPGRTVRDYPGSATVSVAGCRPGW